MIGDRRFNETLRSHPDLCEAAIHCGPDIPLGRRGNGILAGNIPGIIAAHDPDLPEFSDERLKSAAPRRVLGLLPPPIIPDCRNSVIDRYGVAGNAEARPWAIAVICLTKHEICTTAGKLNCF